MSKLLWTPSEQVKQTANMTRYIDFVNKKYGQKFQAYNELYDWSVNSIPDFWASVWDFVGIKASQGYQTVIDDVHKMPGAKWFTGARLNFAENLLRYRDNHTAFIFKGETQKTTRMSYAELYETVARLAQSLRQLGIKPGDRVCAYMPNMIETAVAMLATTSIGAIWASCAVDIGPQAVIERFGQIEPKVLFCCDGYFYKGKPFNSLANVADVVKGIPSIKKVIVTKYKEDKPDIANIPNAVYFNEFLAKGKSPQIQFEQLPFDHPVYIMFSSGTTGKPKCLVQSAGGILINQLKELIIHTDLRREDVHFFITTCSWMMWNWMMTSLATGNTLILYDGNPLYPDTGAMWRLVQDEKVTMFGTSASYINYIRSEGLQPGKAYDLSALREIWQTGSVLSAEGFEYIYSQVKADLHFNSSSGGTDINGCFCTGSPIQPVYAGQLQGPALGMKIKAYDEKREAVYDREGELVCEAPAPSMPLCFWNDPDGKKYHDAYFIVRLPVKLQPTIPGSNSLRSNCQSNVYPNIWRHGDYVIFHKDTGGITFFGRSDAVLKPSGVRIGTAEIYNQVEKLPEVADSLAIGHNWQGDQRVILFVKLAQGHNLTEDLKRKINQTLRQNASPRHMPARIIAVPDIPYTMNMKKVESAVTNIINGRPVTNRDALKNPESLDYFENLAELRS